MKRLLFPAVTLFAAALLAFGCSNEKEIEKIIAEFEDAVNTNNAGNLKATLSEESDFYVTGTFSDFLAYFNPDHVPVSFPSLDISTDGRDGDARTTAVYYDLGLNTPVSVLFVMRRKEGFFQFLNPEWRILQYWDDYLAPGTMEYIWRKIHK